MKRILMFLFLVFCYVSGFSQSVSTNASTYNDGEKVIMTVSGETSERYIQSFMYQNAISTAPGDNYGGYVFVRYVSDKMYQPGQPHKSEYSFTVHNSYDRPITVDLMFTCNIFSLTGTQYRTVRLTVKPKPVVTEFGNDAKSQVFYKNNCPSGAGSDPYTYSVPSDKYKASTKQEANNLAQNEINANGQNTANANRQCYQLYYNKEISGSFVKNNCANGPADPSMAVPFTIAANTYSAKSQSDADALALANLNTKGQENANAIGRCNIDLVGPTEVKKNNHYIFYLDGVEPNSTVTWSVDRAKIMRINNKTNAEVKFNMAGSAIVLVTVRSPNGDIKTIERRFEIADCDVCPIE